MLDFKDWSDKDVLEEAHRQARNLSYYNAAEGNWDRERQEREACYVEYRAVMREMNARGLEFVNKGYLL